MIVDLPEPLGPESATVCPALIESEYLLHTIWSGDDG